jgi:putative transcriptional regulator
MNNRIREYRARLGMTQDELARRVNVRRETIVFLEKNKYNPSLRLAFDLARVFEVSIETLFIYNDKDHDTTD